MAAAVEADDCQIVDEGMAGEETLQFDGGELEALILDELLDAVGDAEVAVSVLVALSAVFN